MCRARDTFSWARGFQTSSLVSESARALSFCVLARRFRKSVRSSLCGSIRFWRFYEYGRIRPYSGSGFCCSCVLVGNRSVRVGLCLVLPCLCRCFGCSFSWSVCVGALFCFLACAVSAVRARLKSFISQRDSVLTFLARRLNSYLWAMALAQSLGKSNNSESSNNNSNSSKSNAPTHGTTRRCTRPVSYTHLTLPTNREV